MLILIIQKLPFLSFPIKVCHRQKYWFYPREYSNFLKVSKVFGTPCFWKIVRAVQIIKLETINKDAHKNSWAQSVRRDKKPHFLF